MRTGWKVEIPLSCVVLCTFPDMSSSCARATISVIVGNEDRELNESLFIGMGTSGCDNSQRGVSEGVSPATFASPLSVNLPVHLSVCHTMLTRLTNSIYKGNMCHMYCAMRKSSTLNVTHWSAILLLFNIFHQFLIITPVVEIKNSKVFYQSCLVDSHQTDSSITQPLHLSLTLIRNPFQMSSQFFFHNKMQCGKKKERTDTVETRSAKRLHVKLFLHTMTLTWRYPKCIPHETNIHPYIYVCNRSSSDMFVQLLTLCLQDIHCSNILM